MKQAVERVKQRLNDAKSLYMQITYPNTPASQWQTYGLGTGEMRLILDIATLIVEEEK